MRLAVLALSVVLAGCAGTSLREQTPYQADPAAKVAYTLDANVAASDEGVTILRERLNERLNAARLLAANASGAARTVEITIVAYRMRHGAARALVGVMAGTDYIHSSVVIKDAQTQQVLGEARVESRNPTAWGSAQGLIQGHADAIVAYIKSGKK